MGLGRSSSVQGLPQIPSTLQCGHEGGTQADPHRATGPPVGAPTQSRAHGKHACFHTLVLMPPLTGHSMPAGQLPRQASVLHRPPPTHSSTHESPWLVLTCAGHAPASGPLCWLTPMSVPMLASAECPSTREA